jgi:uncharacterized SAM-binding protein YcdF (DUF218 family)
MRLAGRLALALLALWLGGFIWFRLSLPPLLSGQPRADGLVVVTGGEGRLDHATAALRDGEVDRVLISGVYRQTTARDLARLTDTPMRLFRCCVDIGHAAGDTIGNAAETAVWVERHKIRTLRLVTSRVHMPRTALEVSLRLPDDTALILDPVNRQPSWLGSMAEYSKYLLRLIWVRSRAVWRAL